MSAGLAALFDDIALIAKAAAASIDDVGAAAGRASAKAAGVVVDDAAVTPRYVHGFKPERELPIIKRIAIGSLRNKLVFILPVAMLLSQFLPWLLTPILMIGGTYLCYEGAEKIWEKISGHHPKEAPAAAVGPDQEKVMVGGAIRTDFILSAEIMVIALNEVASEPFVSRLIILIVVAIGITALVYGAVGLIVKMDDIGLRLAETKKGALASFGRGLVKAMPGVLATLSTVGIIAMLWVGGHILLVGTDELGWTGPYKLVHAAEVWVGGLIPAISGALAWITNTFFSAIIGLIVGGIVVAIMHVLPWPKKKDKAEGHAGEPAATHTPEPDSNAKTDPDKRLPEG